MIVVFVLFPAKEPQMPQRGQFALSGSRPVKTSQYFQVFPEEGRRCMDSTSTVRRQFWLNLKLDKAVVCSSRSLVTNFSESGFTVKLNLTVTLSGWPGAPGPGRGRLHRPGPVSGRPGPEAAAGAARACGPAESLSRAAALAVDRTPSQFGPSMGRPGNLEHRASD
jgi:hypothetical protein